MTPSKVNLNIVSQRAAWIKEMIENLHDLPIENRQKFLSSKHTVAAAESYLRRALEALFDIGRHILARGYEAPVTEYKEIAQNLFERKILHKKEADILRQIAGYRNRMVHFYHEISPEELQEICAHHLDDIKTILNKLMGWVRKNMKSSDI
ncbi:MAG: DUF86 domain-containing protein [Candidatus Aminicenantes bacterium]